MAVVATAFASCKDDLLEAPGLPGEGSAPVEISMGFMPMSEADNNTGGSRAYPGVAPPGDGMNTLTADDVCLLFYDSDGNLMQIYSAADFLNFNVSDQDRNDSDVPQGPGTSGVAAVRTGRPAIPWSIQKQDVIMLR